MEKHSSDRDTAAVSEKARRLMVPVIGSSRIAEAIDRVNAIEEPRDVRELMRLLGSPGE
jgi:hypothetical protein